MPATYTVHLTDAAGSFDTTLDDPRPTGMTPLLDENNGPGSFMFTMGLYDPQIAGVVLWATEVAVYRDAELVWAGPIVDDAVDFAKRTVTFTCGGLLEYFYQRLIDVGAGRTDLLEGDGDFEEGAVGDPPPGWVVVEDPDLPGLTAEIDDTEHRHGARSVKLTQPDPGADAYIKKQFTFTAGGIGDVIVFKAWFKLDPGSWVGPALEGWGLVLRQIVAGVPLETEQGWRDSNRITSDTPRGKWIRVEDFISVLPDVTAVIEVDHFAPGGVSWWDYTAGFLMESLSLPDTDQALIAQAVILFLEDATKGKNDLSILVDCPLTGVIRSMTWQYADHTPGNVALGQLTGLDDGVDFGITAADRTFRTWFPHRGTDRTGTVTLVPDGNCIVKTRKFDGRSAANQVTQGWLGDGPDREEEGATDPAAFGGVTLQKYLPPVGTPEVDTLAASALRALAVAKVPIVYEATIFDPDLQATLELGDTVAAGWNLGYVQESNNLRIITYARDPNTDALIVQLTPNGAGSPDVGFGRGMFGSGIFGG